MVTYFKIGDNTRCKSGASDSFSYPETVIEDKAIGLFQCEIGVLVRQRYTEIVWLPIEATEIVVLLTAGPLR